MAETITKLRRQATMQLLQYRRNRHYLAELHRNVETAGSREAAKKPAGAGNGASNRSGNGPHPGPRELKKMRCWIRAIDRVRDKLRREQPQKERFMNRCFGLDAAFPCGQSTRARMLALSMEQHVSESTAYKWRETVLDLVLFAAIEAGALTAFGAKEEAE